MSKIVACLGGWCALREHCPHYHAEDRSFPSERLCRPGSDGLSDVIELHFRPAPTNVELLPSQQVGA